MSTNDTVAEIHEVVSAQPTVQVTEDTELTVGEVQVIAAVGGANRVQVTNSQSVAEAINAALPHLDTSLQVFTRGDGGQWILNGIVYEVADGKNRQVTDANQRVRPGATYVVDRQQDNG